MLFNERARFDLAVRLRGTEGAPIGEVFSFLSGLYFRAKLLYALTFGNPPPGLPPALVITPGQGLRPPWDPLTVELLREYAAVRIDLRDERYRVPLERDAKALAETIRRRRVRCDVVLLGSVATDKYSGVLAAIFELLRFPSQFVGRGDMSRGGLMLRCVDARQELDYVPFAGSVRHGPRPARLEKRIRRERA
jgi:hypothetical protein